MQDIFHEKTIFNASLVNLYPILIWIKERLSKYFPEKDLEKIELASEEVITNIIIHGYKKNKGSIEIEIFVNECVNIIFKDKAAKFNPLTKRNYYKTKKINKIGGLGIFLILQSIDEVIYKRKDKVNILTLKMKRNKEY